MVIWHARCGGAAGGSPYLGQVASAVGHALYGTVHECPRYGVSGYALEGHVADAGVRWRVSWDVADAGYGCALTCSTWCWTTDWQSLQGGVGARAGCWSTMWYRPWLRLLLAGWQSAAGQPVWWRWWVPEVCELPTNWCRNRIRYACDRPGELPLAVGYGAQMLSTEVHEMG